VTFYEVVNNNQTINKEFRGQYATASFEGAYDHGSGTAAAYNTAHESENFDQLVLGGTGDDILTGSSGSDFLVGGDGNDLLVGGIGYDKLTGGLGRIRLSSEKPIRRT
jgi:Ca2+-binding RTX toxin-like protein